MRARSLAITAIITITCLHMADKIAAGVAEQQATGRYILEGSAAK